MGTQGCAKRGALMTVWHEMTQPAFFTKSVREECIASRVEVYVEAVLESSFINHKNRNIIKSVYLYLSNNSINHYVIFNR